MKHYAALIVILVLVAGAHLGIAQSQADQSADVPKTVALDLPARIGPYRQAGQDQEVSEGVKEVLQTSLILMRRYTAPSGWPIDVTLVYAGATRRSLHFPEVCLVGQGWEIEEQTSHPVGFLFRAKRLVIVRGDNREAVLYWFKTGEELTGNFFLNSWHWAMDMLSSGDASSCMVRISAPIAGRPDEDIFELLEEFSLQFVPVLMDFVK